MNNEKYFKYLYSIHNVNSYENKTKNKTFKLRDEIVAVLLYIFQREIE